MAGFKTAERLAIYTHIRTFESDFDKSQSQIRAICSAWSAAVLVAIGTIVISAVTPPPGPPANREEVLALLRGLVCIVGSGGVLAFWYVDQRVYQRLLHSAFAYGLQLEVANPELPQIRSALFVTSSDITEKLGWFYRVQFLTFFAIHLFFAFQPPALKLGPPMNLLAGLAGAHLALLGLGLLSSMNWPSLGKVIENTYPDLNSKLPKFSKPCDASSPKKKKAWRERIGNSFVLKNDEPGTEQWTAKISPSPISLAEALDIEVTKKPKT